jgi:hypothetical protein
VRSEYDRRISAWYADGCPGCRPDESADLAALENTVRQLTQDGNASRPALADAQSALDEQSARLGSLGLQKTSALFRAAAEAAGAFLETECRPAMIASLLKLGVIENLAAELRRIGIRDPEAMSVSRDLDKMLLAARQSVAVRGSQHPAADFLARLGQDPTATLSVPQEGDFEVVELADRSIKRMEDGTRYLNRGLAEPSPEPTFETSFGQPAGWAFVPPQGNAGATG